MRMRWIGILVMVALVVGAGVNSLRAQGPLNRFDRECGALLRDMKAELTEVKQSPQKLEAFFGHVPTFKKRFGALPDVKSEYRQKLKGGSLSFLGELEKYVKESPERAYSARTFEVLNEHVDKGLETLKHGPEPGGDEHDHGH